MRIWITENDWKRALWPLRRAPVVENNVMRHNYRELDEKEKRHIELIKDKGLEFTELLYDIGGRPSLEGSGHATRELGIAAIKIEEAVMWATKSITRPRQ